MEEMELQNATVDDTQDRVQMAEAKHHYDVSKFDRPSVTVDGNDEPTAGTASFACQASFLAV
jgi:hypothetical protein